jgi:hypothetical protein
MEDIVDNTTKNNDSSFFGGAKTFVNALVNAKAQSGHPGALALQAVFSPDEYKKYEQQRANASRLAELQLKQAELNFEQAQKLAPLRVKQAEANLANIERQGRNSDQLFEHNKELFPLQKQSAKTTADYNLLRLQQEQNKAWTNEYHNDYKLADERMKNQIGWEIMDDAGRAVIENSPNYKAMLQSKILFQALQNNPEKAKFYLKTMGWSNSLNDKGENLLTSTDGKKQFVANDTGIRTFMENMQKNFMDDVTAARIIGTDAQNFATGAAKVVLSNPRFKEIYGSEGNVFRAYSNFVNKKVEDKKTGEMKDFFTPSQKTTHALSVCLNSAFQDDFFSDAEKGAITPLLVPTLKQKGAEVRWGQGVDDTFVVVRSGGMVNTMPIKEFAQRLSQDDVISQFWDDHVTTVAQKMKANKNNASPEVEQRDMERKLYMMYGDSFSSATPAQREKVFEAAQSVAAEESELLKKQNKTSRRQLSIDDLQRLDTMYTNITGDEKKFYSPYRDEILIRELAQLEDIKKNLMQAKKTLPGKNKNDGRFGYVSPVPHVSYETETRNTWHSRVEKINSEIEARRKELAAHGVNVKGK